MRTTWAGALLATTTLLASACTSSGEQATPVRVTETVSATATASSHATSGSSEAGDATAGAASSRPTPRPSAPVTFSGEIADDGGQDLTSVEAWLADVGADDEQSLRRNCWTWAPETVSAMYLADRDSVNRFINSRPPEGAQYALSWSAPDDAPVSAITVYWKELESSYACPLVRGRVIRDTAPQQARYIVERLIGRANGTPVHPDDTPENYFLGCEELDLDHWDESTVYDRIRGASISKVTAREDGEEFRIDLSRDGDFVGWLEVDAWMFGGCVRQYAGLE